jgi:uncharacterized protein
MWSEYLPASCRELAPHVRPGNVPAQFSLERVRRLGEHAFLPTPSVLCVGDRPIWADLGEIAQSELAVTAQRRSAELQAGATAAGHLESMDKNGIDLGVVLPTYASYLVNDDTIDARRARLYAEAYNRFMGDFVSLAPRRLCAPILLARQDPSLLTGDLESALRQRLAPIVLRPNPVCGRTLSDPMNEPFWAACAEASVPVLLHEGTHARVATLGSERFQTRFGKHACSHPMEMMAALLSLIEGGVLERHPGLRVCFLEAGCGWMPYWLWRLDEVEYRYLRGEVRAHVRRKPSEYFQRQCWIAADVGEPLPPAIIQTLGIERLVAGTDFPHLDHASSSLEPLLRDCRAVSEEAFMNVAGRNAQRLLGEELCAYFLAAHQLRPPSSPSAESAAAALE